MTAYLSLDVTKVINSKGKKIKINSKGLIGLCPVFEEKSEAIKFVNGDESKVIEVDYTAGENEVSRP